MFSKTEWSHQKSKFQKDVHTIIWDVEETHNEHQKLTNHEISLGRKSLTRQLHNLWSNKIIREICNFTIHIKTLALINLFWFWLLYNIVIFNVCMFNAIWNFCISEIAEISFSRCLDFVSKWPKYFESLNIFSSLCYLSN